MTAFFALVQVLPLSPSVVPPSAFLPGDHWSVSDWAILIGAAATAIVLVVNAIGAFWGRKEARQVATSQNDKLNVIHDLTNSSMSALKEQLAMALTQITAQNERIAKLEEMLRQKRHWSPTGDGTSQRES